VVLLLIITLLSLFSMIAITYVVSAGSHKKAAYALEKGGGYYGTEPKDVADSALYMLLVGTTNPKSPFQFHDILGDMYGHFGLGGKLGTVKEIANGEMIELTLQPTKNLPFGRDTVQEMGYLAGSVITLLNGDGIGLSTNIIWQGLGGTGPGDATVETIRVRPWTADEPRRVIPKTGDRFWINGQPFSGLGFGYNRDSHMLDRTADGINVREAPNFAEVFGKTVTDFRQWQAKIDNDLEFGGANEEFDAPGIDNMFLAYVPADPNQKIIPSFHNAALIKKFGATKKTIFRPMKEENPNFTGSNPRFEATGNTWDVDNDRDGRPDSIWIDPGWPVQVAANGQAYKHLVAVMVRPMDGGINLNVTGNLAHAAPQGAGAPKGGYGLATGPAELDPGPLSKTPGWFQKLLGAQNQKQNIGRYGTDGQPGTPQDQDRLRNSRNQPYPANWTWRADPINARDYGSPPPFLWSTKPIDLDPHTGQPMWDKPSAAGEGANVSPYELDPSRSGPRGPLPYARDALYTYAEYERLIRRNDADVTALPNRLYNNLPEDIRRHPWRVTPESWDLPQPNVQMPKSVRDLTIKQSVVSDPQKARVAKSYVDILRARIKKAGGNEEELISAYCPSEMRAGLRMDLNRPFGNGQDDNHNGIIDEGGAVGAAKGEGDAGEPMPGFGDSNLLNDDPLQHSKNAVRDVYMRNLYTLILAVCLPGDDTYDWNGGAHKQFCDEVAQWVANVCDMRDRDDIMTRFVYDLNPFDGWTPSPALAVFGVERPELIITEALAGHDSRIEVDGGKPVQRVKPQGWVYIELYNPWTDKEPFSGELYQHSNSKQLSTGVVLDQLSPPLNPGDPISAKPVWRIMFHRTTHPELDDVTKTPPEGEESRTFYFDDKPVQLPGDGTRNDWDYFRRTLMPIAPIRPGQFAVIGSRKVQELGQGRQIKLVPSTSSTGCVVDFMGNRVGEDPISHLPPVAIVVDGQRKPGQGDNTRNQAYRPANVTEPGRLYNDYHLNQGNNRNPVQGGYPDFIRDPGTDLAHSYRGEDDEAGSYTPTFDRPLDNWRTDERDLATTGFKPAYRIAHLQRLADPSKPFHARENPFRTIDSMWMDMTKYNSKSETDSLQFTSRERGVTAERLGHKSMLWMQEPREGAGAAGLLSHSFGKRNKALGGEGGDNSTPYPWLTFFNRPFANPMELLMVPRVQSKFLLDSQPNGYGYTVVKPSGGGGMNVYEDPRGHFRHLKNFFFSRSSNSIALSAKDWNMLFEFVGVPSPFAGSEFSGKPENYTDIVGMRPPFFNKMSSYRDPGKLNLNAVSEQEPVAVVGSVQEAARAETMYSNLIRGRNGGESGAFEHPFRSFAAADLEPPAEAGVETRPIDMTIFRAESSAAKRPLFAYNPQAGGNSNPWPNRNPYFYYQSLIRMSTTTTTRSNTYAIWITVGKFEAESVAKSDVYPDGYRLGAELGWDTGNVERHRAFYMIDRTIPVACQPGQINNIHRAIMVSRLID
jgi:hypothetical protein